MFYDPFDPAAGPNGDLRCKLIGALIGLARATEGNDHLLTPTTGALTVEALAHVHLDEGALQDLLDRVGREKQKLVPECSRCACPCGRTNDYDLSRLQNAGEEVRSLKCLILLGIRGIAAYAWQAEAMGFRDEEIHRFLYKGLFAVGMEDWGAEELLPILPEVGEMTRKATALLYKACTESHGQ